MHIANYVPNSFSDLIVAAGAVSRRCLFIAAEVGLAEPFVLAILVRSGADASLGELYFLLEPDEPEARFL